ncbi:carbohydrate ABC transporter permease [Aquibacillus albus]|uniref:Arabinosaccharide transport system permease protein n=1 Tax=Aquibacillus albus TaxID=1168171 RepID=A0ABS2MWF5_9BACI|nr:carbohydrate ABC transporter permease [Aquibacillus albus]MBM7570123.1 arabinosaccharide transport system permease protein [Aquibacillus albus]
MGQKLTSIINKTLLILFFTFASFIVLFPFYVMLISGFKPATEIFSNGLNVSMALDTLTLENYIHLFTDGKEYFRWYSNSILITVITTIGSVILSSFAGYALAIYRFKGRNLIFGLVIFLLLVPVDILMLPLYRVMIFLGLVDTYAGVILPFIVTPFVIFFFRQYAIGLPKEIIESARIDGCTEFGCYVRIMAPMMLPAFGAMSIIQAMNSWNNFLWPLIVLRSNESMTLPIGLASLISPYGNNYGMLLTGSTLTVVPILIVFLFFQRYFVAGITMGGVKG